MQMRALDRLSQALSGFSVATTANEVTKIRHILEDMEAANALDSIRELDKTATIDDQPAGQRPANRSAPADILSRWKRKEIVDHCVSQLYDSVHGKQLCRLLCPFENAGTAEKICEGASQILGSKDWKWDFTPSQKLILYLLDSRFPSEDTQTAFYLFFFFRDVWSFGVQDEYAEMRQKLVPLVMRYKHVLEQKPDDLHFNLSFSAYEQEVNAELDGMTAWYFLRCILALSPFATTNPAWRIRRIKQGRLRPGTRAFFEVFKGDTCDELFKYSLRMQLGLECHEKSFVYIGRPSDPPPSGDNELYQNSDQEADKDNGQRPQGIKISTPKLFSSRAWRSSKYRKLDIGNVKLSQLIWPALIAGVGFPLVVGIALLIYWQQLDSSHKDQDSKISGISNPILPPVNDKRFGSREPHRLGRLNPGLNGLDKSRENSIATMSKQARMRKEEREKAAMFSISTSVSRFTQVGKLGLNELMMRTKDLQREEQRTSQIANYQHVVSHRLRQVINPFIQEMRAAKASIDSQVLPACGEKQKKKISLAMNNILIAMERIPSLEPAPASPGRIEAVNRKGGSVTLQISPEALRQASSSAREIAKSISAIQECKFYKDL